MIDEVAWAEVDEILDAALDLPPGDRASWLDAVCAGRLDVRARVEQLLALAEEEDRRLPLGAKQRILDLLHSFASVPPTAFDPPEDS